MEAEAGSLSRVRIGGVDRVKLSDRRPQRSRTRCQGAFLIALSGSDSGLEDALVLFLRMDRSIDGKGDWVSGRSESLPGRAQHRKAWPAAASEECLSLPISQAEAPWGMPGECVSLPVARHCSRVMPVRASSAGAGLLKLACPIQSPASDGPRNACPLSPTG